MGRWQWWQWRSTWALGELQVWSAPPSVNAASCLHTYSPFTIRATARSASCRTQRVLECLCGRNIKFWATTTASSLPSSGPTLPRDAGGRGGDSVSPVLVENLWNTERPQVRVNARHPPLEDAFAVGGMDASLPAPFSSGSGYARRVQRHSPRTTIHP